MANIIIGTGGTGGHIFPARSLAKELSNRGYKVTIFADQNYLKYKKSEDNFNFKIITCSKLEKQPLKLVIVLLKIGYGFLQSLFSIFCLKPQVIITFGGYATFSLLIAAVSSRRKIIIHEQNAYLGKVNRIFAPFANKIALSFKETGGIKPQFLNKTTLVGNPVRDEIIELAKQDYQLNPNIDFNILVIGGSGGAKIFSQILPKAISKFDDNLKNHLQITQQCRSEFLEETRQQYQKSKINANLSDFFFDIKEKIAAAHLVIARAGSSSIAEFCAAKKPMILVPFAKAADNHQQKNAAILEKASAAIVIKETEFTVDKVSNIIKDVMSDKKRLLAMSKNAAIIADIEATKKLADISLSF